jgi:hypothetical protein
MLKRLAIAAARVLLYFVVGIAWLWCVLALYFYPLAPRWLGAMFALAFAVGTIYLARNATNQGHALRYFCIAALLVLLVWIVVPPTHNRAWSKLHAVMPQAEFSGDRVTVRNIRKTIHGQGDDYQVQHYDRTYDLNELESVWFGVQYFRSLKTVAHTFISFGFAGGDYLAISVESRRGEGEGFSPLAGFFKQYALIYIAGDEREVIGQRTLGGDDPIYLYPIKADRQQVRAMLLSMLRRANQLSDRPEFYHTLTNNCTTNIVNSFNEIAPIYIWPYSPRIIFNGFSGHVAYDQNLIDTREPFAAFQARAQINTLARTAADADDFSQQIRANLR